MGEACLVFLFERTQAPCFVVGGVPQLFVLVVFSFFLGEDVFFPHSQSAWTLYFLGRPVQG